jgi:hypothetical protein
MGQGKDRKERNPMAQSKDGKKRWKLRQGDDPNKKKAMDPSKDSPLVNRFTDRVKAREWIAAGQGNHFLAEMSSEDSMKLVERIFAMGAREVWGVKLKGTQLVSAHFLIIALPEDEKMREDIFKWSMKHTLELGFDPEPDNGQAHIAVRIKG